MSAQELAKSRLAELNLDDFQSGNEKIDQDISELESAIEAAEARRTQISKLLVQRRLGTAEADQVADALVGKTDMPPSSELLEMEQKQLATGVSRLRKRLDETLSRRRNLRDAVKVAVGKALESVVESPASRAGDLIEELGAIYADLKVLARFNARAASCAGQIEEVLSTAYENRFKRKDSYEADSEIVALLQSSPAVALVGSVSGTAPQPSSSFGFPLVIHRPKVSQITD